MLRDTDTWDRQTFLRNHAGWMDVAQREIGQIEVPGLVSHNPRICEYLRAGGAIAGDETAWCSAFVNWVLETHGYSRTRRLNARSWLEWGEPIAVPRYGAITIFKRDNDDGTPNAWKGHVAFYVEEKPGKILVLGGNQANQVNIQAYAKSRVIGYRWPRELEYDGGPRRSSRGLV